MSTQAFTTPSLPYAYDALEPFIDKETMLIHHDKHHVTYTTKLNAAITGKKELEGKTIESLLQNLQTLPSDLQTPIRNHGGGHYNHSLFWEIMTPKKSVDLPKTISEKIVNNFGSLDTFKTAFTNKAINHFGSGWVWLIISGGKLDIEATTNQDSPLSHGATPILGIDLWEHAYYLKYKNMRADYVAAFWNVINWPAVEQKLHEASA